MERQVADLAILRVASGPMRRGLRIARWHAGQCPGAAPSGNCGSPSSRILRVALRTDVQRIAHRPACSRPANAWRLGLARDRAKEPLALPLTARPKYSSWSPAARTRPRRIDRSVAGNTVGGDRGKITVHKEPRGGPDVQPSSNTRPNRSNSSSTRKGPDAANKSSTPFTPQSSGKFTNCTSAPRVASSRAIPRRAHFTLSLMLTSASKTMSAVRSFHAIRLRSAIGPFTSTRSPFGPLALPTLPRQFQTPGMADTG